ncbi:MAG: PP2C family protein-serine/threonine phosphatase [Butyrivibrio sp.]|nr:PP2C family protein-serine/threonine phosphatase [Butyrivibrio sp.]
MPEKKSLQQKAFAMVMAASIMLLVVIGGISFVMNIINTMQSYKRETAHDMRYAVSLIDADYLESTFQRVRERYDELPEEIRSNPDSDEYLKHFVNLVDEDKFWETRDILVKCKEQTELDSVSILLPDFERNRLIFVVDGYDLEGAYLPGQWISTEEANSDSMEEIHMTLDSDRLMFLDYGTINGWIATNYIELYDRNGNFMGYMSSDINLTGFINRMLFNVILYFILLLISVTIIAFCISRNIQTILIAPINKLASAARDYTKRDKTLDIVQMTGTEYFKDLKLKRTGDEIESLWESLADMEKDINATMQRVRIMTAEKERISAELDVATKIQANMLPKNFALFPDNSEFTIFASMIPAKEVGGDFYDAFKLDDTHLCLVIGDVSGKGVPAALFMVRALSVIRNAAKSGGVPSEILKTANNELCIGNDELMFVTVWLGILNIATGELLESNAGHEKPAIKTNNGEYTLIEKTHDSVLGVVPDLQYQVDSIGLNKGDCVIIYTDGLLDATDASGERFNSDRMISALNMHKDDDPKALLEHMFNEIDNFVKDAEQFDDLTMLAFRYDGSIGTSEVRQVL